MAKLSKSELWKALTEPKHSCDNCIQNPSNCPEFIRIKCHGAEVLDYSEDRMKIWEGKYLKKWVWNGTK